MLATLCVRCGWEGSSPHYTIIDFCGCTPSRVPTHPHPPAPRHATSFLGRETHLPVRPNAAHMSCCICLCFAFWAMLGLDKHTDIGAAINTSAVVSLALTVALALTSWPWCALR
jgi:hypothetical protein